MYYGSGTVVHTVHQWPPSKKYNIYIRNPTLSITDAYLLVEQSCQISPQSDLKRWSFRLSPRQEQEQQDE